MWGFFLTACSPLCYCVVSYHSILLLYFMFGNDAPPIESCITCIPITCKKLCCSVLFAVVFFSCSFWRCTSGLSSHLDHNFFLPVGLSVILRFE